MNGITRSDFNPYRQSDTLFEDNNRMKEPGTRGKEAGAASIEDSQAEDADTYTPSVICKTTNAPASRSDNSRSEDDIDILNSAIELSEKTISEFKDMVNEIIYNQGGRHLLRIQTADNVELTDYGITKAASDEINVLSDEYGYTVGTGGIGEDDFWGVNATAQRIFEFAVSLSGGDLESMKMLKNTVHEAFKGCEGLFGGKLPDISYQTLDKIDSLFEEFETHFVPIADVQL